jgi:HD-GYP domain-containing protein (c-di-GMP phosphodiesterase class II)
VPIVSGMRLLLRERVLPLALLLGIGGVLPVGLLLVVGRHMVMFGMSVHFVGVGVSALAATAVSLALTIVGVRRKDGRVVLIGTGFTVMSALLAIHGLATPGVLIGMNGVLPLTGAATLPAGAAVLALSAAPPLRRPRNMGPLLALQAFSFVAVFFLGLIGLATPRVVPSVPAPGSTAAWVALVAGAAFFAVLLMRALKTYLLTRRRADLVVVIGIAWLTAALPPALLMNYEQLGWWLGHLFELVGIISVGVAVAVDLFRPAQSRSLVGDLRAGDLVAAEEAFLGARVHALTRLLADKDESTEEHTRRVAMRAVQLGEELGLPPGRLRDLAIGGLLHDIGKLSVPERILKKPGALSDEEFAAIKLHPGRGVKLLRELGGFGSGIHELVHSHHERLDGKGYPRGLDERELSVDIRIMTVCDVYDALVSPRVYRDAWTHDDALALLRRETGTAFDERCVAALERVLAREDGHVVQLPTAAAAPSVRRSAAAAS